MDNIIEWVDSPITFAVVLTAYICLTFACLVFMDVPDISENMSWIDFLRSIIAGISVAAFFIGIGRTITQFSAAYLIRTIVYATIIATGVIVTRTLSKKEASADVAIIVYCISSGIMLIGGIISMIRILSQ